MGVRRRHVRRGERPAADLSEGWRGSTSLERNRLTRTRAPCYRFTGCGKPCEAEGTMDTMGGGSERLPALVHHIVTLCEPEELGKTKLAKILWFADVAHYRRTGRTLTGATAYRRKPRGPLHADFYPALAELERTGRIVQRHNPTPAGARHEFFSLTDPDLSAFSAEEIALVDRIVARVKRMSAAGVSDRSHDVLWEETPDGSWMSVGAAAVVEGEPDDDAIAWAEAELERDAHRQTA